MISSSLSRTRVLLPFLMALLIAPVFAQTAQQQKYVVSVGTASEKLRSGTLWLYSYSWYGLQQYKLAAIQDGVAVVPLDIDRLKKDADPHPNTDAYVVVIQEDEHLWFRTPDIAPTKFWTDLRGAVGLLGSSTGLPTGEIQLVVPAPVKRRLTFLYPDGRPKVDFDVQVSIYMWDQNRCGVHFGLTLGDFRTDAKGAIEVFAPSVPLYLDGLQYYTNNGTGPAGAAYSRNIGMKVPAEESTVIKTAWEIPEITVQLRIVTPNEQPRAGVNIYGNWNTNTCGGGDRIAQTDAAGSIQLNLDATITGLTLMIGGPYGGDDPVGEKNTREIAFAELQELFSKHKLTIRW